jgi:trehalose 6-phosphate synthase/phosphatase
MYNKFMAQNNAHNIVENFANAQNRLLLLDYDGTLAPLMPRPEQAAPTEELRQLLGDLAAKAQIVVISGRDHNVLDDWLGDLPIDFAAEHGLFYRENGNEWQTTRNADQSWKKPVKPLMQALCDELPKSLLEESNGTLNWHYRDVADAANARAKAEQLIIDLEPLVHELDLSMLDGSKVVTVKLGGVDKGLVAQHWLKKRDWDFILAAGDDTTDEFLFSAMPASANTVKIGQAETHARSRIKSVDEFLNLLKSLSKL